MESHCTVDMSSFPMNIIALVTLGGGPAHLLLIFSQKFLDYSGVSELRENKKIAHYQMLFLYI